MGAEKPGLDTRLSQNSATAPSRIIPEAMAAQTQPDQPYWRTRASPLRQGVRRAHTSQKHKDGAMHDGQTQNVHRCVQAPDPQTRGHGDPGQGQKIRSGKLTVHVFASSIACCTYYNSLGRDFEVPKRDFCKFGL